MVVLTTNQKGAIAETAIVHAAIKLGAEVYRPVADGGRYDLILTCDERLLRAQSKWAVHQGEVAVQIRLRLSPTRNDQGARQSG